MFTTYWVALEDEARSWMTVRVNAVATVPKLAFPYA